MKELNRTFAIGSGEEETSCSQEVHTHKREDKYHLLFEIKGRKSKTIEIQCVIYLLTLSVHDFTHDYGSRQKSISFLQLSPLASALSSHTSQN